MAEQLALSLVLVSLLAFGAFADQSLTRVEVASQSNSLPKPPKKISRVLVVDHSGQYGKFIRIQHAINSVPSNNEEWIEIRIRAGVYREKVTIPLDKPYISIVGEGRETTIISWSDGGGSQTIDYATFKVFADNVVVRGITFENTYQPQYITQAPAALIYGDKVYFDGCGFVGVQDTLTDLMGRHYFQGCYIEGYIDFIWGYGQSIYHGCTINVTAGPYDDRIYGTGYITAHGRPSTVDEGGFVFKYCKIVGTSQAYLGRPYQRNSRVVFYKNFFSNAVVPQGWSFEFALHNVGQTIYEEVKCKGPGASNSKRLKPRRRLSKRELNLLINPNTFINKDHWIEIQPLSIAHS